MTATPIKSETVEEAIAKLDALMFALWEAPECPYCGFYFVHRSDCLDRMNEVRTPTGDWWKI